MTSRKDNPRLESLLEKARSHQWTPEERKAQMISLAYGNVKLHNPEITREDVERIYEQLFEVTERVSELLIEVTALNPERLSKLAYGMMAMEADARSIGSIDVPTTSADLLEIRVSRPPAFLLGQRPKNRPAACVIPA